MSIPQQIGYTIFSIAHPLNSNFEGTGRDWTLTEKRVACLSKDKFTGYNAQSSVLERASGTHSYTVS
jgi:hypothetical protein